MYVLSHGSFKQSVDDFESFLFQNVYLEVRMRITVYQQPSQEIFLFQSM